MNASNVIAAVSAVIAALGLFLAAIQFVSSRQRTRTERERLAQQEERLQTAYSAARMGIESADLIVQRAKDKDVTLPELQNIARVLRGSLAILAKQLDTESKQVAELAHDKKFQSYAADGDTEAAAASDLR